MSGWHAPWSDIDCFPIQILFDKNGQPFRRYASMVEPFEIEEDIISLLAQWKLWIECFSSPRMTSGSKALAGPGRWGSPSPPCAWGRVLWRHWTRKYTVSLQQYTCFCQEIWMISLAFFQLLGLTSNRAFDLGRDDLKRFLSCAQICSPVTERNAYVYMRNPEVAPYTPHEYYLCDRIFVYKANISFSLKIKF